MKIVRYLLDPVQYVSGIEHLDSTYSNTKTESHKMDPH